MTHLLVLLLVSQSGQVRATDLNVGGAADVRGYRRGVDALGYDPAAGAFADGFELQYRQRFADDQRSFHGVQAVMPGPLTLGFGYDWFPDDASRVERATLNFALRGGPFALGASYQRYRVLRGGLSDGGVWNLGLFTEATRWLTLSAGVDAVNSPAVLNERQRFAYRLGGSVRPLLGSPWLTLGAETRFDGDDLEWGSTRAVMDVAFETLHGFAAYDFNQEQAWFGLSIGLGGIDGRASVGTRTADAAPDEPIGALAVTLRANPAGEPLIDLKKTVEVALQGDLKRDRGFFRGEEEVSPIAYELAELAKDDSVDEVIVSIGSLEVGGAEIESVRESLRRLRNAGKRVIAEISYVDERGYLVAAAANVIRVDPAAILRVDGFAVTRRYYAEALRKIGVRFTAIAIGDYKTAPDALTRSAPRPEDDEVTNELLDYYYGRLVAAIVEDRGKTEAEAKALIDRGLYTAKDAIAAGLVDELLYSDDPNDVPEPRLRGTSISNIQRPSELWGAAPTVAVVPVVGSITSGPASPLPGGGMATSQRVVERLEEVMRDDTVDAVVLFVDSPGGEVGASDVMWRAIKRLAARKPVVTCMGDVAASGGYWIATATDTILAEPGTITGSIGIFQLKPDIEKLYDMLDITAVVNERGELADINTETRAPTEEEIAKARAVIEKEYDRFIDKVAVGRGLDPERVRQIAGGRVYTGARAKELGLVDELGGLTDAIELAAAQAGLDPNDYEVKIPVGRSPLLRSFRSLARARAATDLVDVAERTLERVRAFEGLSLAILPFEYEVEW